MDSVSLTEWPLFVWKFKNLFMICQEVKTNCSVQGHHFNLILEQNSTESPTEEQIKLEIEELRQKSSKDTVIMLNFQVRTYIIGKSENRCCLQTKPVTFDGNCNSQYIWGATRGQILANFSSMKQEKGEIRLVCIFEPMSELEICQPKFADRTKKVTKISEDAYEILTEETPWVSLEALSRDFDLLRDTQGDISVAFAGKEICVHRNIIVARCPKLAQALEDAVKSNAKLSYLDEASFGHLMKYIYSGGLPDITVPAARKLYEFASKYEVDDLMKLCAKIMTSNLTEINASGLLLLADKYKDERFKKSITDYILRANILKSEEWISFSDAHMKLALEVHQAYSKRHLNLY